MVSRIPGAQKFVMSNARAYDSTKDSKTDECVICFENFSDSDNKQICELNCKHIFHVDCMIQWTKQKKDDCPMCRQKIESEQKD